MKPILGTVLAAVFAAALLVVAIPTKAHAYPFDECHKSRPLQVSDYETRVLPFAIPDSCIGPKIGMGQYLLVFGMEPRVAAHEFCAKVAEPEEPSDFKNSTCTEVHEGKGEWVEVENDEWLVGGTPVESALTTRFNWTIELTDLKVPIFGESTVRCELTLDGNVNGAGIGEITEALNTKGENKAIICKGIKGACGTTAEAAEVTFGHFPWESGLGLEGETFYYGFGGEGEGKEPNFKIKCISLGLEDTCENHMTGVLTNGTSEALVKYSLAEQEEHQATRKDLETCTQGGAEAGHINGEGKLGMSGTEEGKTIAAS